MDGIGQMLIEDVENDFKSLKSKISHMRHSATLEDEGTYLIMVMDNIYPDCVNVSSAAKEGTLGKRKRPLKKTGGVHASRVQCLRDRLQGGDDKPSIFQQIASLAREDLEGALETYKRNCYSAIEKAYGKITQDFDRRFQDIGEEPQFNPVATKKLQDAVDAALRIINGPLKVCIDECKQYEESSQD